MKLVRRLGENRVAVAIACWLIARYIRLVEVTTRWSLRGFEPLRQHVAEDKPFVAAFWHGRMVLIPGVWRRIGRGQPIHMLISQHRDGRLISRVISHLGIHTISGSSSRGGAAALRAMRRSIEARIPVAITPDGPRGPRMRASIGVAGMARLTGVPVLVLTYASTRRRLFRSWDRFMLPLPFGRAVFVMKGPFEVPRGADEATLEAARQRIEDALNEASREADEACGLEPIEPAPEAARDNPDVAVARR